MAIRRIKVVAGASYSRPLWNLLPNNTSVARYGIGSQTATQADSALLSLDQQWPPSQTFLWLCPGGSLEWTFSEIYQDGQRVSSPNRIRSVGNYLLNNKISMAQPFLFPDFNQVHLYRDITLTENGSAKIAPHAVTLPDSFNIDLPFGQLSDAQFDISTTSITGTTRQTWNRKIIVTYTVAPLILTLNRYDTGIGGGTCVWTSQNVNQRNINIKDYYNIHYSTTETDWLKITLSDELWCGFLKPSENSYSDLPDGNYSMSDLMTIGFLQKLTRVECWQSSSVLPRRYDVGLYGNNNVINPLRYYL